MTTDQIFVFRY